MLVSYSCHLFIFLKKCHVIIEAGRFQGLQGGSASWRTRRNDDFIPDSVWRPGNQQKSCISPERSTTLRFCISVTLHCWDQMLDTHDFVGEKVDFSSQFQMFQFVISWLPGQNCSLSDDQEAEKSKKSWGRYALPGYVPSGHLLLWGSTSQQPIHPWIH